MKNVKKIKYIGIVTFCAILDMILHIITSKISPLVVDGKFSSLAETIGVSGAAVLWIFIAFPIVAYVFYSYEDKLPGIKSVKGLYYGGAIGLLWLWGMIETVSIYGNNLIQETVMGLCDGVPVLLMGLLLGTFTTKSNPTENKNKNFNKSNIFSFIFIFSFMFLIGRYFLYFTKIISSGFDARPYATFIWTLIMGALIGVTYILLGQATKSSSTLLSSIKFGIVIFGINWTIFLLFIPFVFGGTIVDIIIRSISDTSFVILSYYLSESLAKTIFYKHKQNIKY